MASAQELANNMIEGTIALGGTTVLTLALVRLQSDDGLRLAQHNLEEALGVTGATDSINPEDFRIALIAQIISVLQDVTDSTFTSKDGTLITAQAD